MFNEGSSQALCATREEWLRAAVERLRPDFSALGSPVPPAVQVSVGFPSVGALARRKRRIGETAMGSTVPRKGANTAIAAISSRIASPAVTAGWRRTA